MPAACSGPTIKPASIKKEQNYGVPYRIIHPPYRTEAPTRGRMHGRKAILSSRLVSHLKRLNGWRLWMLFSVVTVVAALVIVSLMDLALMGRIEESFRLPMCEMSDALKKKLAETLKAAELI